MTKTHCVNIYSQRIQFFATTLSEFEDFESRHKKKIFETKTEVKKNNVTSSKELGSSYDVINIYEKRTNKKKYHVTEDAHGAHRMSNEGEHSRCSRSEQDEQCSRRSISEQNEQCSRRSISEQGEQSSIREYI